MNFIMAAIIFAVPSLFFLKGKNEVIVKYEPGQQANQYTIAYAKNSRPWEEALMKRAGNWFYHTVPYDSATKAIAIYFKSGTILDDNTGMLYLYEVKLSPRMLFPVSLKQLDRMLKVADTKLASQLTRHDVSEAMTSIDYVIEVLNLMPEPMYECSFRTEKRRLLDYANTLKTRQ